MSELSTMYTVNEWAPMLEGVPEEDIPKLTDRFNDMLTQCDSVSSDKDKRLLRQTCIPLVRRIYVSILEKGYAMTQDDNIVYDRDTTLEVDHAPCMNMIDLYEERWDEIVEEIVSLHEGRYNKSFFLVKDGSTILI
jgi:hypothetical protein